MFYPSPQPSPARGEGGRAIAVLGGVTMAGLTLRVQIVGVLLSLVPSLLHAATAAEVEEALTRAKSFVYSKFADGSWEKAHEQNLKSRDNTIGSQWGGQTALAAYALLAAGDNPNAQPKLADAITFLKQAKLTGTYALGVRCL